MSVAEGDEPWVEHSPPVVRTAHDRLGESGPGRVPARKGLTSTEAADRLAREGPNTLATARPPSSWRHLLAQMTHFFALLLWVAAALAFVAGMPELGVAIIVVVLINGATNRLLVGAVLTELVFLAGFLFIEPVANALDHAPPAPLPALVALLAAPAVLIADALHKSMLRARAPYPTPLT